MRTHFKHTNDGYTFDVCNHIIDCYFILNLKFTNHLITYIKCRPICVLKVNTHSFIDVFNSIIVW